MNGDHDAVSRRFESAYRRYYPRVYRFLLHACRVSDDEAHDLAHDTFKRFFERLSRMRGEDEWPFLQAIARTVFFNWWRAHKTQKRDARVVDIDTPGVAETLAAPPEPDYVERQQTERRRKKLYDAIASLPQTQQDCIAGRLDDKSYDEIADDLGITVDAVKSRLRDAKKSLRNRLGDANFPEEEQ